MTLLGSLKVGCVIAVALSFSQRLYSQVPVTANIGPIVQTRPDDGTPIAATIGEDIGFGLLRKLHSSFSFVAGYNDNVNTVGAAGGGAGSPYINGNATFSYSFGSPRSRVSLAAGGGINYYFDRAVGSKYDENVYFALSLMHNFTKRVTLTMNALASYQSQPDLSTDLGVNQAIGNYLRLTDANSLSLLWGPRFSTITSYNFSALKYESGIGSLQDQIEQTFGQQARFLLFPSTTIDGEYRFEIIDYTNNAPLNSTTNFFLAGFEHRFSPHLNVTFRSGVEIRSSDDNGNGPAPYFESTITYRFGRRISVTWANSYSIEESNTVGGSSGSTFRTGLVSQITLTRRLSASLALNYVPGGGSLGDTFDVAPSVNMMINRHLFANAGYHYTNVSSDVPLSSYSQNIYFAGFTFSF